MRKSDVVVGMRLTIKRPVEAEYFGPIRAFTPEYPGSHRLIQPGEIGTVAHVDVPAVHRNRSFICLDFEDQHGRWRARPWYEEVTLCPGGSKHS